MIDDLVSIIIPVYNAEKYIQIVIDNIKNQTYQNWELIIVDDNSTDKSVKIIKQNLENSKIRLVELKENKGPANARNIGLKKAQGRFIAFNDADDLWIKEKLEKQLNFIKEKNVGFSYTGFEYIKNNKSKVVQIPYSIDYKIALKRMKIITSTVMIDTKKIPKELCQMPNIIVGEDVATWFQIMKKGYKAYGLNENLMKYLIHKDSLSSHKLRNWKNRFQIYRKQEKLSVLKSICYTTHYAIYAIIKRVL